MMPLAALSLLLLLVLATDCSGHLDEQGRGYELFPGLGYYKLFLNLRTWRQAERACAEDGAHLVIVNSLSESKILTQLLDRVPTVPGTDEETNNFALVGFHDLYEENEFLTVFGSPLNSTGFFLWHENNPDNGLGIEDCGGVHRQSGKLVDLSCESIYPFFCEINLK